MSIATKFKSTETLLFEREELHKLVDFFWKHWDYTRDQVYDMIRRALHSEEIVHISDMSEEQIRTVARTFQRILSRRHLAPCRNCEHCLRETQYGMFVCEKAGDDKYYWNTHNAQQLLEPCKEHVWKCYT